MTAAAVPDDPQTLWAGHHAEWRDPAQVVSQWREADRTDPALLRHTVRGDWWGLLAERGITLLVTREYEHLVMALGADAGGRPHVSFLPLPHPSGAAVDRARGVVHVASTRNPNQVYDLMPVRGRAPRAGDRGETGEADDAGADGGGGVLVPVRSRFLPGCLYLHDLALIGGALHGSAAGQNAVVRLHDDGRHERVWWPRAIETDAGPVFNRNHLQLNSIAAGAGLDRSFFSASAEAMSARRPGHRNFPVDRRGVVFSGATREPAVRGLTRPHSARLYNGAVWVDNSGYGEVGAGDADGRFTPVARLPGWTRGLCFHGDLAFVGTSRVIPRFRQYAPGLDVDKSVCGVHAVDAASGRVLASLRWPAGNQIFAVEWLPRAWTAGLPFRAGARRAAAQERRLFSAFDCFGKGKQ